MTGQPQSELCQTRRCPSHEGPLWYPSELRRGLLGHGSVLHERMAEIRAMETEIEAAKVCLLCVCVVCVGHVWI